MPERIPKPEETPGEHPNCTRRGQPDLRVPQPAGTCQAARGAHHRQLGLQERRGEQDGRWCQRLPAP